MELKIKVKCPICKWKGEIGHIENPQCPCCFMDLITNGKALLELLDKTDNKKIQPSSG